MNNRLRNAAAVFPNDSNVNGCGSRCDSWCVKLDKEIITGYTMTAKDKARFLMEEFRRSYPNEENPCNEEGLSFGIKMIFM